MTAESTSPDPDQNYIAIIGDLRHSRRIRSRAELQRKLIVAVEELNDAQNRSVHGDTRAAPVSMTAGDEVQALIRKHEDSGGFLVDLMEKLSDAASPSEFTFGVGIGTLSTALNDNIALIDGPAFHNAREALQTARRKGHWASAWGATGYIEYVDTLGALLALMGHVRSKWTDRQRIFIDEMRSMLDVNHIARQSTIAEKERISPSVVSESLRAAGFQTYVDGIQGVKEIVKLAFFSEQSTP